MSTTKKSANLLTEGSIPLKIIAFAIPIFWGSLFQQLYNVADSLIVGNFIDSDALAAVSSSGSLIFMLVGFFNGISVGAGVVIAKFFGAKERKNLEISIHTTVALGIIAGLLLTAIGVGFTPSILRWMDTPTEILASSITYLRIYFLGSMGFVLYNIFVGILRAVGDSKTPLYYLIISSIINVLLDFLFIAVLGFGVGAAALATIISQYTSAILSLRKLLCTEEEYRLCIKKIHFDAKMLKQILLNGLPIGLQNSIISFSNVVIQSSINFFGNFAVAGVGAFCKIEGFAFLPTDCFMLSLTTFVSQNLGAKKPDRVKKGVVFSLISVMSLAGGIGLFLHYYAQHFIALFNSDPNVIAAGLTRATIPTLFYSLLAFSHCSAAILRGGGRSMVPMFVMLFCWCVVRVIYVTTVMKFIQDLTIVFYVYPLTWALSSLVFIIYLLKSNWLKITT